MRTLSCRKTCTIVVSMFQDLIEEWGYMQFTHTAELQIVVSPQPKVNTLLTCHALLRKIPQELDCMQS
jgi:hypothetical protein